MKRLIALLLAACMTVSLAACGGGSGSAAPAESEATETEGTETEGTETEGTEAEAPAEQTADNSGKTLTVNIWDNNQLEGLRKIADEWSAKTGVKVQINVITWVEYWTLLEAGAMGGEMPDVFWMHINEAQKYMRGDMLLNLNDYIAKDDAIDLNNYYEGIVDIYSLDGNQFALPKDHDTIALLYNKAIFDKYGVEYPNDNWTWDDYAAAAAKIQEAGKADGKYGTAMNTNDGQDGWYNLISAFCSEEGQKKQAELGVTMAAYKGCSDAFVSAFEGMDISPFLTVEESGTLIKHPASRYTTAWEGQFTTGLVPAWQNPSTMADVCKQMADMMNEVLASE